MNAVSDDMTVIEVTERDADERAKWSVKISSGEF